MMTTLITIRDHIKGFMAKYDKFAFPVLKFLGMLVVFISFNIIMGYSDIAGSGGVIFILSLLCSFLPISIIVLLAGLVGLLHMISVSIEVAAVYVLLYMLMYLLYMRFAPKYGWIIMVIPLLYLLKLHYMIPIIIALFVGPVGIVPMIFGVLFYYFAVHVNELSTLMATASEEGSIQGYSYLMNALIDDKAMMLTMVVFAIVIMVTYVINRQSVQYSWMIAIGTGVILNIVFLLVGGIVLEVDIHIITIFLGSLGGGLLAVIAQFFKGIVDYARVENVQFEDDEYIYYVKAVPKIRVATTDVQVKKIVNEENVVKNTKKQQKK